MLPHVTELLERNFECRLIGNIGPGMSLKVVKLLTGQLAWTELGFEWHADTKHSQSVLLKHGLVEEKRTSAVSPGSKASGQGCEAKTITYNYDHNLMKKLHLCFVLPAIPN